MNKSMSGTISLSKAIKFKAYKNGEALISVSVGQASVLDCGGMHFKLDTSWYYLPAQHIDCFMEDRGPPPP
jgi:hypothetical protein